jgi:hypothetical protein
MPKLRINFKPRFEQKVSKLMSEAPLLGRTRKTTWEEAARIVCKRHPEVYEKYLKQLKEIAKGEK